ncbi:uncharacterized protein LOC125202272 [Salvia hispanica]|uniref:uncharacterized protein LOC125202272 n=1 Tax=Salvia hispanica TaxID=49212 RepID=UPI002009494D|nr:uncharacterized protein LOC125202272 [Salvia hispanica]
MKNSISNKKVPENFEKCLKDWKLPPSSASDIFWTTRGSSWSPFSRVNTVEKEIPLNRGSTTFPLYLSKLRKIAHKFGYSFTRFGMIQVGLKPIKLGSNTSAIIVLRDKGMTKYEDSVLSKAESSLCDGPIYFTYFPTYCVPLNVSCDTFVIDVKINGSGGSENVVLMYKFHYEVVNMPFLRKYSGDFPVDKEGETTIYLAKIAEGNLVVSKTISWFKAGTGQGSVVGNELSSSSGSASVDWRETVKAHVLKVDVPGFKKEEVKVVVKGGRVLQISGERSNEEEEGEETDKWHCEERSNFDKFLRRLKLPKDANVDVVKAEVENGVLTVTVPKKEVGKEEVKVIDISG